MLDPASPRCETCGTPQDAGDEFCPSCGAFLEWPDPPAAPATAPATAPSPVEQASGDRRAPDAADAEHDQGSGADGTSAEHAREEDPDQRPGDLMSWWTDAEGSRPASASTAADEMATQVIPVVPPVAPTSVAPTQPSATPVTDPPDRPGLHPACRDCGRMNDNRLRFCSKCGNALVLTPSGGSRIAPRRTTWWERRFGSQRRAERRAYRRNLPAFYRWRPVIVGGVVVALVGAGTVALVKRQQSDPDNPVVDAWYAFHQYAVPLQPVRATVLGSTLARGTTAAALTDTNFVATTMEWKTPTEVPCAAAPTIELHWSKPERIRWIAFRPGLPMFDSTRNQEFRPKTVEISTGDPRRCIRKKLNDVKERQQFDLDTKDPRLIDPPTRGKVTVIRIAVIDAYPPEPAEAAADPSAAPSPSASASPSAAADPSATSPTDSLMSFTEIRVFRMREAGDGPPPPA